MASIDSNQIDIAARYRTLVTLWLAMIISLTIWLGMTRFVATRNSVNLRLGWLLICFGLVPISISLLVKIILVGKAIEQHNPMLVQQAYVIAWALCEVAALLGFLAYFVAVSPHYYVAFMIALIGMLLHFPQRKHLLEASGQEF